MFGYSPGSYVYADRRSASRFFWSRPVILDFNREDPRYGVAGLRADLERNRPGVSSSCSGTTGRPTCRTPAPSSCRSRRSRTGCAPGITRCEPFIEGFQAWERNGR